MRSASSGGLELSVDRRSTADGEIAVVRAQGEVDLGNADELAGALGSSTCVESDGVVIDLLGVPFMDSSGLRVVLVAAGEDPSVHEQLAGHACDSSGIRLRQTLLAGASGVRWCHSVWVPGDGARGRC